MDKLTELTMASCELTVFYEAPFWIGVFGRVSEGKLSVSKVTFGAEPKDFEVQEFILRHYCQLRFSPAVTVEVREERKNPKRIQREVQKKLQTSGIGTKSWQALKLQQEQMKTERKTVNREKREAEKQHQFELGQQKKKEKHRGR